MVKDWKLRIVALSLISLVAASANAHAACSNEEIQFVQQLVNRSMYAAMQMNVQEIQRLELEAQQRLSPSCQATLRQYQAMQPAPYGGMERPRNFHKGSGGAIYGPGVGCDGTGCYSFD